MCWSKLYTIKISPRESLQNATIQGTCCQCLLSGATVRLEWNCTNTWTSVVVCNLRNDGTDLMFVGGISANRGLLNINCVKLLALKVHRMGNQDVVILGNIEIKYLFFLKSWFNPKSHSFWEQMISISTFKYQFSSTNPHFEVAPVPPALGWLKCGEWRGESRWCGGSPRWWHGKVYQE